MTDAEKIALVRAIVQQWLAGGTDGAPCGDTSCDWCSLIKRSVEALAETKPAEPSATITDWRCPHCGHYPDTPQHEFHCIQAEPSAEVRE